MAVSTVLLAAAALLFALAAFGVTTRIHLGWAGACIAAVALLL